MFRDDIRRPVSHVTFWELDRESVGLRTNDQDIVELLHAVELGKQLVDHSVMDSRAASHTATLFTDCINLIKYDDVKATVGAKLFRRDTKSERIQRILAAHTSTKHIYISGFWTCSCSGSKYFFLFPEVLKYINVTFNTHFFS